MATQHLWFETLALDTIEVFARAFQLSAKKRGNRVSTERFLAALPDAHKAQMTQLCVVAQNECKMSIAAADLPAPALPIDWQEKICFSTCIENTLRKCSSRPSKVDLTDFLTLLCRTAVRLNCIVDRNLPVEAYITRPSQCAANPNAHGPPSSPHAAIEHFCDTHVKRIIALPRSPTTPDRWRSHPRGTTTRVVDELPQDVLEIVLSKASGIEVLRMCKAVCRSWQQAARRTLCDVGWLVDHQVSLHEVLKKGRPSPRLALSLADKRPEWMQERDGEGLLPLQYAAAYRMDAELVAALRKATASCVPSAGCALGSAEARSIRSHLRPVTTRVSRHGPLVVT